MYFGTPDDDRHNAQLEDYMAEQKRMQSGLSQSAAPGAAQQSMLAGGSPKPQQSMLSGGGMYNGPMTAVANRNLDQGGRNPNGMPDFQRAANDGVIASNDYRVPKLGGGGGGGGAGLAGVAGKADLAPWAPGSAGGAPAGVAGPAAAGGAGAMAGGPLGAAMPIASVVMGFLQQQGAKQKARHEAQAGIHHQMASDMGYPGVGYAAQHAKNQIDEMEPPDYLSDFMKMQQSRRA